MKITMIACDAPACKSVSHPEFKNRPPYGWIEAKGSWYGCGPTFKVVVCSLPCLAPAIQVHQELDRMGG